jgi:hypothetical protein
MSRIRLLVVLVMVGLAPAVARAQEPLARADQLRNAGRFKAAAEVLRAFLQQQPEHTRAQLMLAETLYWQGDFSGARRYFRMVLEREPDNSPARRQLSEIEAVSAPWLRVQWDRLEDNQPLDRNRLGVQGAVYVDPLWSLGMRIDPEWVVAGDSTLNLLRAEGTLAGYLPSARTELELSGGVTRWQSELGRFLPGASAVEPTGRARLGVRAGGGLVLSAIVERMMYTATVASLAEPVPSTNARLQARLDQRGWLGEAAVQRESYPDDNAVMTTYTWLLAPLVRSGQVQLHAGYAFSYQDAASSRFVADSPQRPGSGALQGHYVPYFTPEREMQHGIAASFALSGRKGARLQLNGSYGAYARRDVPIISRVEPGPGPPNRNPPSSEQFRAETFHPYNAHAAGTLPLGRVAAITLEAERLRTSFYQQTRLSAFMSLRFVPRSRS